MIYSEPYNKAITPDISRAWYCKDVDFFEREIKTLCSLINARAERNISKYDRETSRLLMCLAMHDSLLRYGETIKLACDMVNF